MGTIAQKLTAINDSKIAIKNAIESKGVSVGDAPLSQYAGKVRDISGGEDSRYGTTLDALWGPVDGGTLRYASVIGNIVLPNVQALAEYVLGYKFSRAGAGTFSAPDLLSVSREAMVNTFEHSGLTAFDMPQCKSVAYRGMAGCCAECQIAELHLDALEVIEAEGLQFAFRDIAALKVATMNSLKDAKNGALQGCFRGSGLTRFDFPSLTAAEGGALSGMFDWCNTLTEIHFRADAQSLIESLSGYSDKFGASNATIYFDL